MLRASVLDDPAVIQALQKGYANAWVLARDLPRLAKETQDPDLRRVYELLSEHYSYPVDSIVIGPDLRLRGQIEVMEAAQAGPAGYLAFLRSSAGEPAATGKDP